MENGIKKILVENIDSKIAIWPLTTSASFTHVGSHFCAFCTVFLQRGS